MAIYECLADLQGKTLKYEDTVILKGITYTVQFRHLQKKDSADNSKIFRVLSIPSKEKFATDAYGYECDSGDWPECKLDDYEALTRCVIELYKIIEGKTSITPEKKQCYKITTPGKTGISSEQVKALIIKYGGIINPIFEYKSKIGIYIWTKNTEVRCLKEHDIEEGAIEVSPTTEITTTKKEEKHETQFQRKKACVERGTRPEGSTVCGRRGKASVAVGHLGYRKVIGI